MTAEPPAHRNAGLVAEKAGLRALMRTARVELGPAARAVASADVCAVLEELPELDGLGPFLLYAAFGDELNLDPLIAALLARGAAVCLPRVDSETLAAFRIDGLADLAQGWRGVREPPPDAPEVPVEALRALVVPGLAFDPAGKRLGYGGGHFDRLLARLPDDTPVIGAAFDVQVVPQLPVEGHDRAVHAVVTESRIIRTR